VIVIGIALRLVAPSVLSSVASPLWHAGSALTALVHRASSTDSKQSLIADRDRLVSENNALSAKNAALAAQVTDLTRLLGTRTAPEKGIVASVLARPPVAPYDVLILDQGTDAGVAVGSMVMGQGGTPIGTVGEADEDQSRVALFSTSGLKHDGWVGESRLPVTVTGAGAGAFRAAVPKEAGIAVGDAVYLAGFGAFPIGTVISIEQDPSSPSSDLDVRPYANPFSLTWVTVAR
jgi:cell shape-determining protein MreC